MGKEKQLKTIKSETKKTVDTTTRQMTTHQPGVMQESGDPIDAVKRQVEIINRVYKEIMVPNKDYGKIPGTDKPTLLKPGAEKIVAVFQLAPKTEIKKEWLDKGHINVEATVFLYRYDGVFVAQGVGSCSTLEKKYRYRYSGGDIIGPVPKEYWKTRNKSILNGGVAKKTDTGWMVVKNQVRIENEDLADEYNTVIKMADKRGLVSAVLKLGASVIFTQDMEDKLDAAEEDSKPQQEKKANATSEPVPNQNSPAPSPTTQQQKPVLSQKELDEKREQIRAMIMDCVEGDMKKAYDVLFQITSFPEVDKATKQRTGKIVPGKRNVVDLSDKAVPVVFHKVLDEWKIWRQSEFVMANSDMASYDLDAENHLVPHVKRK